ncbi:hypothetical protein [Planococcus chinensis]|uniref:DUF3800 domain-containing protein n=1 Tax=Planococcus chinensis TaxID=272917 RepID=A0ABW4QLQ2_9BACL
MEIAVFDDTNARKRRVSAEDDFELQIWSSAALISHFLDIKGKKDDIKHINLFCRKDAEEFNLNDPVIDGFWDIVVPYDPNILLRIKDRKEKVFEVESFFRKVLFKIWEYKAWDSTEVELALQRAKKVNFTYAFLLKGTPKKAPDKKHTATVNCIVDFMSFRLTCSIYDRFRVLVREEVMVEELPSPFIFGRFVGNPVWESNEVFSVLPKLGGRPIGKVQVAENLNQMDDKTEG